jgi:hypothetical protein
LTRFADPIAKLQWAYRVLFSLTVRLCWVRVAMCVAGGGSTASSSGRSRAFSEQTGSSER